MSIDRLASNDSSDSLSIIGLVVGATTITLIAQATDKTKHANIKPIIGGFIVGILLLMVGLWSTEVAKTFAILLFVTALVVNGGPVFDAIGKVTN